MSPSEEKFVAVTCGIVWGAAISFLVFIILAILRYL